MEQNKNNKSPNRETGRNLVYVKDGILNHQVKKEKECVIQ